MLSVCAVNAAELQPSNTSFPTGNAYEEYTAQIEMPNGNEGYTFEFERGIKPVGITINSDGSITGIPTSSGLYSSIYIRISHEDGSSAVQTFSMLIMPRKIKVTVAAPTGLTYDALEHEAEVKIFDINGTELHDLTAKVSYGTEKVEKAVNAGTYHINISAPSGCLITEQSGDEYLTIERAVVNSLSVKNKSFNYDGQQHGVTADDITVEPAISYAVEYRKNGEASYTTTPPKSPATYTVRVYTTNPNYETVYATSTLSINAEKIDFTAADTTAEYDGTKKEAKVAIANGGASVDFSVSYTDKEGNTVDPIEAGTYNIVVKINNDNYELGTVTPNTLVIEKKPISFEVTNNSIVYDGQPHTATITPTENIDGSYYTVGYQSSEEVSNSVTVAGVYDIVIEFTNTNYKINDGFNAQMTILPKISMNIGNSPAAMIMKDSSKNDEWKTAALLELRTTHKFSTYVPTNCVADIVYTPINNVDYDLDVNTVIVNKLEDFVDPGVLVENGTNNSTVKGSAPTPTAINGIYQVTYPVDSDSNTRNIIVLNNVIGDANGDGNVNAIDSNVIKSMIPAAMTDVRTARICNVNKDDSVNLADAEAIRNRFSSSITAYYPWL